MKKNVGGIDRVARLIVGLGLLSLTVIGPQTLWGLVGIVPILTATFSFCPVYPILGMSTCPIKK
jgi:hypothetical protein